MRLITRIAPLALALAACTSLPDPTVDPGPPAPLGTADTCGAAPHVGLIGQRDTALERVLILREVRVIRPGMAVSKDLRPQRINFWIDAADRIARITCA